MHICLCFMITYDYSSAHLIRLVLLFRAKKFCFWQFVPRRATSSPSTHRPTDNSEPWLLDVYPSAICTSACISRRRNAGTAAEFVGARRVLHTPQNVSSGWPRWKHLRGTTSDEQTAENPILVHFMSVSPLPYVNCTMSIISFWFVLCLPVLSCN
jgi:hypothetical protein